MSKVRTKQAVQVDTKVNKKMRSGKSNSNQCSQNTAPVFNLSSIMEISGPRKPKTAYMFFATEKMRTT